VTNPRQLDIVRTVVTETFPILPYIFFDSASTTIPNRYHQVATSEREQFDEGQLPRRSLSAYYEILNIVGSRLADRPETKITVNGTTDGREETVPGTANNLARARAQSVKDYLVKNWEIDPGRIRVTTSPVPTYPSSTMYVEGFQENRRVEIGTGSDDVLRPIVFERLNEYSADPPQIEFMTDVPDDAPVPGWRMLVLAHDKPVWESEGSGTPPARLPWTLDQDVLARVAESTRSGDSLDCYLALTDADGKATRTTRFRLPANVVQEPFEVSRLSLVVFDFDRSDINPQNRRMVSAFVARSMAPSSSSSITGSTDRLGEFTHNQKLSQMRAESVRDLIVAERPTATITSTAGIGPSRLPYNNDLPEGRYYCRTVTVEVKTPLETAVRP
jgi:outer membrane protein OmpA-like peptidoglycan-associated protein